MRKYTLYLGLLLAWLPRLCLGQGTNMSDPIIVGTYGNGTYTYNDTRNSSSYGDDYGQPSPDVWYRFSVAGNAQISISTCNSSFDDIIYLYGVDGHLITYNDDNGPLCSGLQASISTTLQAGTYYLMVEGYNLNTGDIQLTINLTVQGEPSTGDDSHNFSRTWTPNKPITDEAVISASTDIPGEVSQVTNYLDAFGRSEQSVAKKMSPLGKDVVSMHVYDSRGLEEKSYLPFVSNTAQTGDVVNDGNYKKDALQQQTAFNQTIYPDESSYYYAQSNIENSPLNRTLNTYAPGTSWVGGSRGVEMKYLVNTAADNIRIWNIAQAAGSIPTSTAIYPVGKLYKNISTDEKGIQSITYTNTDGQAILKKTQLTASADNGTGSSHSGWLCTYYVYDDNNNLRFIIPPKVVQLIDGSWVISQAVANELCFRYEYDDKSRMTIKKSPGAAEVQMVYDQRDRLVFSQNGNQRSHHQWIVTYYDVLDRPVETGLYTNSSATRLSLQNNMDTISTSFSQIAAPADLTVNSRSSNTPINYIARNSITFNPGFQSGSGDHFNAFVDPNAMVDDVNGSITHNPLPPIDPAEVEPITYTYYDDYTWTGHQSFQSSYLSKTTDGGNPYVESPSTYSKKTRGLVTGSKTKILNSAPEKWITSTSYYDDNGRLLQSISTNITGGADIVTNKYDFSGKLLSSYIVNHNSQSTVTPETRVLTENKYDEGGRLLNITKTINDNSTTRQVIADYAYDELGQLKTKTLGDDLETLTYDYNIRGWLTGVNKAFTQAGNTDHYFGMELGYDKSVTENGTTTFTPVYNGNISGEIWKSKSDNVLRKYSFTYDKANRLTAASFLQSSSGTWNNSTVNFSVNNLTYDANGNITHMNQYGLKGTSSFLIDQLTYTYQTNSNKLTKVADAVSDPNTSLGDFHDGTNSGNDYVYDSTGNLIKDLNKNIPTITYNYLDLPEQITVTDKGSIQFVYDASGNKLRKIVTDNTTTPSTVTTTDYIDGFVYQSSSTSGSISDTLQFFPTKEGRARYVPAHGSVAAAYTYDYFVPDHLGNIRMVLTEQTDFSQYMATMEPQQAQTENALFYNIDNTREAKPLDYPEDNTTTPNTAVAKLNGKDPNRRIGPSIILKVMAGDTIQAAVRAFYRQKATPDHQSGVPAEQMLAGLLQALTAPGIQAAAAHSDAIATNSRETLRGLTANDLQKLKNKAPQKKIQEEPRAYLNYVFFDDQLNFVEEGSGIKQLSAEPGKLETLSSGKVVAKKSGYVYVYTSNESPQDVLFDNFGVMDITGPVLEETHYYPNGLAMAGISTTAPLKLANKIRYQGKELQSREFADGTGLEEYDFGARFYDPQLGRWWAQDPAEQFSSPYLAMGNNWMNGTDPDGQVFGIDDAVAALIGGLFNTITNIGNINSIGSFLGYFGTGLAAGVATYYGGPLAGGAVLGLGNNLTQQVSQNGWNNISWGQAAISTVVSTATSYAGSALGNAVTPYASKAFSGIASPVLRKAAINAASGSVVGFSLGTGVSLIQGNSIGASLKNGEQGALAGLSIGAITGAVDGLKTSKELGLNPWTGKSKSYDLPELKSLSAQFPSPLSPYEKGQVGLRMNGIEQNNVRIESPSGTVSYRIPDEFDPGNQIIGEVKHYSIGRTVRFTRQISDFMRYAYKNGFTFKLYVPTGVNLAPAIQYFRAKGYIQVVNY
ncbi:DUF6443 domain-containing protein [Compostibacter hankyongensis]|uniref:RHS repeat-associated core domain-containing protein n=1 Tax=Compostibacter hankyongensis TaxID=1007089 RepID=A0ABP8G001_9BACT